MSAINGDKSRFHRQRKAKIARRVRKHKFLKGLNEQSKGGIPVRPSGKKPVAA